jgi:hypothetical protein
MSPPITPYKYLTYRDTFTKAGLWHQRSNIEFLIREAREFNRIPVLPSVVLSGHHNDGVEIQSNLCRYFDWPSSHKLFLNNPDSNIRICLNGNPSDSGLSQNLYSVPATASMRCPQISSETVVVKVVNIEMTKKFHGLWRRMSADLPFSEDLELSVKFSDEVQAVASYVASEMGADKYAAVHIRRGDKSDITGNYTSPEQIAEYLSKVVNRKMPVYLLTDDPSSNYIRAIESRYPCYHYRKFRKLRSLVCHTATTMAKRALGCLKPDNFMLYAIEMCILENADIPIYTFKTLRSEYYLIDQVGHV